MGESPLSGTERAGCSQPPLGAAQYPVISTMALLTTFAAQPILGRVVKK